MQPRNKTLPGSLMTRVKQCSTKLLCTVIINVIFDQANIYILHYTLRVYVFLDFICMCLIALNGKQTNK